VVRIVTTGPWRVEQR